MDRNTRQWHCKTVHLLLVKNYCVYSVAGRNCLFYPYFLQDVQILTENICLRRFPQKTCLQVSCKSIKNRLGSIGSEQTFRFMKRHNPVITDNVLCLWHFIKIWRFKNGAIVRHVQTYDSQETIKQIAYVAGWKCSTVRVSEMRLFTILGFHWQQKEKKIKRNANRSPVTEKSLTACGNSSHALVTTFCVSSAVQTLCRIFVSTVANASVLWSRIIHILCFHFIQTERHLSK